MKGGRVEFIGFGHYHPEPHEVVSVHDFLARQGPHERPVPDQTLEKVGIETRIETSRSVLELALSAAKEALADAETHSSCFSRNQIAGVVGGGATPDRIFPGLAHQLQHSLGLTGVRYGHDVSAACSSWTVAVTALRNQMLVGDYPLPFGLVCIPDRTGMDMASPTDRNSFLWGNGAGATVLAYNPDGDPKIGVVTTTGLIDGSRADWIVARGKLGVNPLIVGEEPNVDFGAYGPEIQSYVIKGLPPLIREHMEKADLQIDNRTFLVPHNANQAMVNKVGARLEIPAERVLTSLREWGNTSGASIPITLSRLARTTFQTGDLLILASFGAGMMFDIIFYRWP